MNQRMYVASGASIGIFVGSVGAAIAAIFGVPVSVVAALAIASGVAGALVGVYVHYRKYWKLP